MPSLAARGKHKKIYIKFRYHSKQYHRSTSYHCEGRVRKNCKCKGCKAALALSLEIERKIKEDIFNIEEYFPNSKPTTFLDLGKIIPDSQVCFSIYADQWLEQKTGVVRNTTITKYRQAINSSKPQLGSMSLKSIQSWHIREILKTWTGRGLTPKTIKNYMVTLSGIFITAIDDKLIQDNPCKKVKTPRLNEPDPDPLSTEETLAVLKWMEKHHPDKVAFYAIGFFSGMRTGEIVGLKWSAIDFNSKRIKVYRQHTNKQEVETTKTGKIRSVDIIPQLMVYLQKHKQYTFMKSDYMFLNQYDKPYTASEDFSRYYWKPCLKALGIHYRTVYHMRHTFACMMLNANMPPNWIAKKMLGHSDTQLLFKTYANYWADFAPDASNFNFLNEPKEKTEQPHI